MIRFLYMQNFPMMEKIYWKSIRHFMDLMPSYWKVKPRCTMDIILSLAFLVIIAFSMMGCIVMISMKIKDTITWSSNEAFRSHVREKVLYIPTFLYLQEEPLDISIMILPDFMKIFQIMNRNHFICQ